MSEFNKRRYDVENEIFEKVIEKKVINNISTSSICSGVKLKEEEVSNYFLGISKDNLPLGIKILNYLEKKEKVK